MTAQRRAILTAFSTAERHLDAMELLRHVRRSVPRVSVATVYRVLRLLEAAGIVERFDFPRRQAVYEVSLVHHDHLIDEVTGEVIEFSDPTLDNLEDALAQSLGYRLVERRLTLVGRRLTTERP